MVNRKNSLLFRKVFMNVEADLSAGHLAIEYFAYDELAFVDSDDCETKPSSALPEPNFVCTFDEGDACGWTQDSAPLRFVSVCLGLQNSFISTLGLN